MPNPLVECVPNFSEGRRPEVIQAIVEAIRAASVQLLDVSSDQDHNRSVVTFVGTPEAVEAAAYAGIQTAAQLIDLDQHHGEHPRLGATDVVPFIPIRDVTMEECIAIAKRLGQRVANTLHIPVYFYEAAASRPERENLENVRRGEYEALKTAINTDPNRTPDCGPLTLGKAGATIIGARAPLIAFNVYLTTDNVEIAKKIAKAMRQSSGGFRFVKGLGLLVDGKAQVSMNLTNYQKTPIYRVTEAIRREAERYGVGIAYTELVGLIPEQALIDSAQWYLQLDMFQPDQILEHKLQAVAASSSATTTDTASVAEDVNGATFTGLVAAGTAAPGGGAVAALVAALSAALAEMVGRLTINKKKYAAVEQDMQQLIHHAEGLRQQLSSAVQRDSAAYEAVMAAYKLDSMHPKRADLIQEAMHGAAQVPLEVVTLVQQVLGLIRVAVEQGNVNAATDGAVAAHMAQAAAEGASLNVLVNLKSMTNQDTVQHMRHTVEANMRDIREAARTCVEIANQRAGLL